MSRSRSNCRAAARRAGQPVGDELVDRPLVPRSRRRRCRTPPRRARPAPASGAPRRTSCSRPPESARPTRAGARCTSRAGWRPCCGCDRGPTPGPTARRCRWHRAPPGAASAAAVGAVRSAGDAVELAPSIAMNHCDVARKITGLWHRQQCGYECWNASRCQSRPRSCSASSTSGLASNTRCPPKSSTCRRKWPAGPDRRVDLEPVFHARQEVVAAVPGRGVHRARALLERDVVGQHAERIAGVERMPEAELLELRPLHLRERRAESPADRLATTLAASASATMTARPSTS